MVRWREPMPHMDKLWHIQNLDIFEGIPKEEIMRISDCVRDVTHPSRALLYTPHELQDRIYLVKQGEVHLYHTRDGRRFVFDIVGPGGLFGNFTEQAAAPAHFAEAAPGTRICIFPVAEFLRIVAARPEATLRLMRRLSERIADYESKLAMAMGDAKSKILSELHRYRAKNKRTFLGQLLVPRGGMPLTHERIAQMTGLNRVTVTRALQDIERDGHVAFDQSTGNIRI